MDNGLELNVDVFENGAWKEIAKCRIPVQTKEILLRTYGEILFDEHARLLLFQCLEGWNNLNGSDNTPKPRSSAYFSTYRYLFENGPFLDALQNTT